MLKLWKVQDTYWSTRSSKRIIYKSDTIEEMFYGLLLIGFMVDIVFSMIGFKIEESILNKKIKERNQSK